ncbi:hypothetical protein NA56DRAFT_651550, partial [Hyaloscypha hepaticicola]
EWENDARPEVEKGVKPRAPRTAKFNNIKEDSRYQNIWDWVCRIVEPALLVLYLELLVSNENLSLQNVIRALRDKFQLEDYKRILDRGKIGSIDPKTYRITEVEGFLVIKDFLIVVSVKLLPIWRV